MKDESPNTPSDETLTQWIDGTLPPQERAALESSLPPGWAAEREAARQLGDLLRSHLPARMEPPAPERFTSSIMAAIGQPEHSPAAAGGPAAKVVAFPRFRQWFAPLASAAAVAACFLVWNATHRAAPAVLAKVYAPDARVTARAWFAEDADATVIELENLDAVPDEREIRAFDVASAEPSAPGEPQIFYAAADPSRAVMVLSRDATNQPLLRALR